MSNMLTMLRLYLFALPIFFIIDMFWLGVVAKSFYRGKYGHLFASPENVNWTAAIAFYLIFIFGLVFFVIEPAKSVSDVLIRGALFGLITYATYDLTNLAVAKEWSLQLSLVDMAWGGVLGAAVSTITYLINQKIGL